MNQLTKNQSDKKIGKENYPIIVTFRASEEIIKHINSLCRKTKLSKSELIRRSLIAH